MPAADVQLYAKDNAGNPLTTLVSNLQSAWLGGANAGEAARTLGSKLRDAVSVRDFGAKGDGVTDDSAAFQAALDAYCAVTVPAGQYLLASEIQVKPRRTITGAGATRPGSSPRGRAPSRSTSMPAPTRSSRPARPTGTARASASSPSRWQRAVSWSTATSSTPTACASSAAARPAGASSWSTSNECSLREIAAGTGGGGDDLLANGIHF